MKTLILAVALATLTACASTSRMNVVELMPRVTCKTSQGTLCISLYTAKCTKLGGQFGVKYKTTLLLQIDTVLQCADVNKSTL